MGDRQLTRDYLFDRESKTHWKLCGLVVKITGGQTRQKDGNGTESWLGSFLAMASLDSSSAFLNLFLHLKNGGDNNYLKGAVERLKLDNTSKAFNIMPIT